MNPLFLLLMAGGAVAVATAGRKKKGGDVLRCHETGEGGYGPPGYLAGGGPDIMLPSNVEVILKNVGKGYGCGADESLGREGFIEVNIDPARMGHDGANFRAVLERVVIPAAVMNPNILFAVASFRAAASVSGWVGEPSGVEAQPREVVQVWPTWMDGRPGAYNEPMVTPMQFAEVFQYTLLRVLEAIEFPLAGNNGYRWMPSCALQKGDLFMPIPAAMGGSSTHTSAVQGSSLQEVLAYEGNGVWGYVDYLMLTKPSGQNWADATEKAHQYARKILTEMNPPCGLPGFFAKEDEWAPELLAEYNYMAKMIHKWIVFETGSTIPYDPEFGP